MLLFMLLVPLVIVGRLFYMQTFLHQAFTSKAEKAIYDSIDEDRLRGKILDVNGRSLAESVRTHSCGVSKRYVQDQDKTITFLAETLEIPKAEILKKWNKDSPFFFVAKQIKPEKYIKIAEILRTPLGQGLDLSPEYERIHPYGNSALDILGTANSKNLGLSGIEQMFNDELSQDISKKRAKRARGGDVIYDDSLKENLKIANIYLTIDETIQFYVEQALKKAMADFEPEHAIAIVQEPSSGKILAAASYPLKDGQSQAFQFTYEPGSTLKTLSIAAGIDSGAVHITDSIDMSGRNWEVAKGVVIKDRQHDKNALSIPEIMQLSSNIGAGKIAVETGAKTLFSYLKAFGLGTKTDINFNGESKGNLPDFNSWTKVDTASKGYGYGVAVTPIQLITAYSAIANNGALMQPHLIDRIEHANGKIEKKSKPVKIRQVISKETAQTMQKILQSVVENGSGKRAQIKGYNVAGKTGTAEKLSKSGGYAKRLHVVSFCGFVPVTDPQFTILIILDNPSKYTFGGTAAAPIFKEIAEPLLALKAIPPDQLDFE